MCDPGGEFRFSNKLLKLAIKSLDWIGFPSLASPSFQFSNTDLPIKGKKIIITMKSRQNNEHHKVCARQHCPCSPQARGGSRHSHEASTTKEAEGGTEGGASDHMGNSITVNIVWQNKKKFVKKKNPKRTQAALPFAGCRAQNWPALLGSHCSRRTMDGSLLAPRMNSSRESFPRKQEDGERQLVARTHRVFLLHLGGSGGSPFPGVSPATSPPTLRLSETLGGSARLASHRP